MESSEYMINVIVVNGPIAVFDTAKEGIDYAKRYVYLSLNNCKIAIDALNRGEIYSYSYGFCEVHITPVKKRGVNP